VTFSSSPHTHRSVTPLVSHIERYTGASAFARASRTGSSIPSVHLHCPHWHYACLGKLVPMLAQGHPNGSLVRKRYISPLSGLNGSPSGCYFKCPPTTHAGPVACRPSPLGFAACASLPCVRRPALRASLLSPVASACRRRDSAAGSLNGPASLRPSLTLRASRPPSSGSFSFFFLVYGCFFRCVISSFVVPCGCWLRCFRRMASRLRI